MAQVKKIAGLKVIAKVEGFYRGGRPWSGETKVPKSDFTEEQIKQLKAENKLVVTDCQITVEDTTDTTGTTE